MRNGAETIYGGRGWRQTTVMTKTGQRALHAPKDNGRSLTARNAFFHTDEGEALFAEYGFDCSACHSILKALGARETVTARNRKPVAKNRKSGIQKTVQTK